MNENASLTEKLRHFFAGGEDVADVILTEVLPKLRQIAGRQVKRELHSSPVSTTELIHEVWIRNLHKGNWQIRDREHFYSIAAYAMRQALIDLARRRIAERRGGGEPTFTLDDPQRQDAEPPTKSHEDVVILDIAMQRLDHSDQMTARVVDLHYFAGFSLEETGEITGLTLRQVRHRWSKGQAFLRKNLPRLDRASASQR